MSAIDWLFDGAHWEDALGTPGIPSQLENHLEYSVIALLIAGVVALPLGLFIGHTRRAGRWSASSTGCAPCRPPAC